MSSSTPHRARRRARPPRPSTPHDALFKDTFSRVEHAAGLLRAVLPPAIVARLELATLQLRPGSFVGATLSGRHTDLLFSAKLSGRPAFIYVLLEHQSVVDPLMAFRLLGYMLRIWERVLVEHPKARRLPAILPLVVHHSETGWRGETAFEALLDLDAATLAALAEHVPRFRFVLDDLSAETDDALRKRAMTELGRLALGCLRHAREPAKLVGLLASWADLVRQVRAAPGGMAALAAIWRYTLTLSEPLSPEDLLANLLEAVGKDAEEEIMTIADQLREEGRREGVVEGRREGVVEGRREGVVEGQRTMLLKQLAARFGALPEAVAARVRAADATQLERWAERVLAAPKLDAVFRRA